LVPKSTNKEDGPHKMLVFEEPTIDMFVFIDRIPQRGSDILGRDLFSLPGGAINISVTAQRLGLSVTIASYIGNDPFEPVIRKTMKEESIDDTLVETRDGRTTTCITLVDKDGERTFITIPGIGKKIEPSFLNKINIDKFDIIYVSGYSLSIDPIRTTTLQLVELAANEDKVIAFDPGTAVEYVDKAIIDKIIDKADILFLNNREAFKLSGYNLLDLAGNALRRKEKIVVIKMGPQGCAIFSDDLIKKFPAFKVNVVDTTGAGDAFNAAFLYCYEKTNNLELCGIFSNLVGALAVTKKGAGRNLPTKQEIISEIEKLKLDQLKQLFM